MHCFGHADWRQEMESNRIMQTSSSEVSVSEVYVRSISTVKMDWKRLSNATRWYERIHRQLYLAGHAVRTDYWADTQATLPGWPCSKNWLLVSETTIPHNFKFYGKFFLHLNSENDVYIWNLVSPYPIEWLQVVTWQKLVMPFVSNYSEKTVYTVERVLSLWQLSS